MDQRKLIKLGNSSYAIALPKDWVERSGLKKGDRVFLVPNKNGEIIVSPAQIKKTGNFKEILIKVDNRNKEKIKRDFITAYVNGYSCFKFIGEEIEKKEKEVKDIVKGYLGCEIVEEDKKHILVKDLFNLEEMDIKNFIRRADNNIKEMFEIIIGGFEKRRINNTDISDIKDADKDINRLYFLISRIMTIGLNNPSLTSALKIDPVFLFNNWWLCFHLEHIGDELKRATKTMKDHEIVKEDSDKLYPILIELKNLYVSCLKTFYKEDKEEGHSCMEDGKGIWDKAEKLTKSENPFHSLIGEKFKNVENSIYQIIKIILHFEENDSKR